MDRLTYRPIKPYISETSGELIKAYSDYSVREIINRLADYEDMEENGKIVILLCKVGEILYWVSEEREKCSSYGECYDEDYCRGCECECDSFLKKVIHPIRPNTLSELVKYIDEIGKTVFLTVEEAKKALEVNNG